MKNSRFTMYKNLDIFFKYYYFSQINRKKKNFIRNIRKINKFDDMIRLEFNKINIIIDLILKILRVNNIKDLKNLKYGIILLTKSIVFIWI